MNLNDFINFVGREKRKFERLLREKAKEIFARE